LLSAGQGAQVGQLQVEHRGGGEQTFLVAVIADHQRRVDAHVAGDRPDGSPFVTIGGYARF